MNIRKYRHLEAFKDFVVSVLSYALLHYQDNFEQSETTVNVKCKILSVERKRYEIASYT